MNPVWSSLQQVAGLLNTKDSATLRSLKSFMRARISLPAPALLLIAYEKNWTWTFDLIWPEWNSGDQRQRTTQLFIMSHRIIMMIKGLDSLNRLHPLLSLNQVLRLFFHCRNVFRFLTPLRETFDIRVPPVSRNVGVATDYLATYLCDDNVYINYFTDV